MHHKDGFSAMGMAALMLLFSSLFIIEINDLLNHATAKVLEQKRQYVKVNNALSALAWAKTLTWQSKADAWQCQTNSNEPFKACIKKATILNKEIILLRGQSQNITRYYLAMLDAKKLILKKGHWLDYCPLPKTSACDD